MFDRGYIKDLARRRLGYGGQGSAIAVLLIAMLLGAVDGAVKLRIHYRVEDNTVELGGMLLHWLSVLMPLFITLSALALLLGILISNVLRVGVRGWFLRYWRGEQPPVGEMFRFYGNALATMLLRDVFIFLWSLLFVIPGIVMTYAYSMTEYILYENPRLSAGEAIRMSKIMTQGYKGELFVFDLSFLLWHLLSGLTLGPTFIPPTRECTRRSRTRPSNRAGCAGRISASFRPLRPRRRRRATAGKRMVTGTWRSAYQTMCGKPLPATRGRWRRPGRSGWPTYL